MRLKDFHSLIYSIMRNHKIMIQTLFIAYIRIL